MRLITNSRDLSSYRMQFESELLDDVFRDEVPMRARTKADCPVELFTIRTSAVARRVIEQLR